MLHTILPRLVPASWTVFPLPGNGFLVGLAAVALAVAARFVEACGAALAALLDNHLVRGRFEGFAVIPRFVGASRAGTSLAGDGVLGEGDARKTE